MEKTRVVIMGAAGRDFHDFNVVFRDNPSYEVVAFTQTFSQNLGELDELPDRTYPAELAGEQYPDGVPILPERNLEQIIQEHEVDQVVLSYSDLSHEYVMHQASRALSAGADFRLIGPDQMMLAADVPVVAVDAVRTGCGKSQVSSKLASILKEMEKSVVVVREPMPYGNLVEQRVQRFAAMEDLAAAEVTIEEREEFEQHIEAGHVVYAGVDYAEILAQAQDEADVVLWDGGNNELPFFIPDLHFVLTDPHRPGHELRYHPGETNLRIADYVVINKENTAAEADIAVVEQNIQEANPDAGIVHADSVVSLDGDVDGKRVLVVEDGPTLTHGGTSYGAGTIAAEQGGADIVDPRPYAAGSLQALFDKYPHLGDVVPAMGYSPEQIHDLEQTIRAADVDLVIAGTPHDLARRVDVDKPVVRARYRVEEKNVSFKDLLERHADLLKLE